ncbi:MAG TPA: DinB family protein [Fimbriiglobus sp.]|jgi:uncharacterized damage-inducible protein DinB
MTVADLRELFDYGHWANAKLFAVVERLTPEQFIQPVSGSHGTIRDTLVHIMSAEWGWIGRCGGPDRGPALNPHDFPSPANLMALWRQVETRSRQFLAGMHEEDLARKVEFSFPGGVPHVLPVGLLLHHAAIHGTHHRGQVSLLLRLHGYNPDNFDFLLYGIDKRRSTTQ